MKLTPTQHTLLSRAAQRDDYALEFPPNLKRRSGAEGRCTASGREARRRDSASVTLLSSKQSVSDLKNDPEK